MKMHEVSPYPQVGQYWVRPKPLALLQVLEIDPQGECTLREWNPHGEKERVGVSTGQFSDWTLLPFMSPVSRHSETDVGDIWLLHGRLVFIAYADEVLAGFTEEVYPFKEVIIGDTKPIQTGPKGATRSVWRHLEEV